jgi:hypothetical protein
LETVLIGYNIGTLTGLTSEPGVWRKNVTT